MALVEEVQGKIQAARLIVLTSLIVALVVNILAFYFVSYPYYTIVILLFLVVMMIFISIHFSEIKTTRSREVSTLFVYDGKTGEITDYPDHIVQHIISQAVRVVSKVDSTLKSRIISPPTLVEPASKERTVFIDLAELVLLRQISTLLSMLPEGYDREFEELSQLPSGFIENSIIKPIVTVLRDERDVRISAISNLDKFKVPKGSKFEVSQNPRYVFPDYRRMVLSNRYIRMTIDYHVSGLTFVSSMTSGTPSPEIGHLPINPFYFDDALKRFEEHGLRMASFYYQINTELLRPTLSLFLLILGLPPSKTIRTFFSFADYFLQNFDKSFFGSISIETFANREKDYWERKFTIETLWQLKHFMDDFEKRNKTEKSENDQSGNDIKQD